VNPISTSGVSPIHSILGSLSQDGASHLLNFNVSNTAISSSSMLPKQIAVEPHLPSGAAECVVPQVGQLGTQSHVSELATLPPFPGREYSAYQGATDPQSNLLFGVNIDSSMLQNGMPNLRNIGSEHDSLSMPFAASNFTSATGTDFPLNSDMTTSSCVDESGFLQSSENVDQVNPSTGTFVKVTKCSISFASRSLLYYRSVMYLGVCLLVMGNFFLISSEFYKKRKGAPKHTESIPKLQKDTKTEKRGEGETPEKPKQKETQKTPTKPAHKTQRLIHHIRPLCLASARTKTSSIIINRAL
jgi:hypothetical protein